MFVIVVLLYYGYIRKADKLIRTVLTMGDIFNDSPSVMNLTNISKTF